MSSEIPGTRRPLREFSYGGVVVRGDAAAGTAEVVAIVPRGRRALALPKGGGDPRESGEETAVREIREETGVVATVREPLGEVNYWYRSRGRPVYKTVRFFLCDYVSGSVEDHDDEVREARWIGLAEARETLTYPGERDMVAEAARRLAPLRPDR